jgi:small conductance mechanosensitive channel
MNLYIDSLGEYARHFFDLILAYSPKLISAILVLVVGLYAIRVVNRVVKRIMVQRQLDPTLSKFLADILLWALRILLFVTFIARLGIETSSFVAILGAAGLAVGLSLQGSLSNFAGGMLIILFKPFRVGDAIEAQGVAGTVSEIQIFVTKLTTANNQTIFIPNGILSNGTIINYSMERIRRADLTFSVSYDTDLKQARQWILEIVQSNPKVLSEPAPTVEVKQFTDAAVILAVRPWAKNEDFAVVVSQTLQDCKTVFDAKGISVQPFVKELAKS